MKTASDPRHQHRVQLMQHLYSHILHPTKDPLIANIVSKLDSIDPHIKNSAPEWPLEHLNPIDLAILRLAFWELLIDKQTPYKVIIDEAVELAKEYGGSGSPGFINGALGKIAKTHESST